MASVPSQVPATPLATAQLAWLGDAVWELHQRLRHCRQPARAADLHLAVVAEVQAEAQAEALRRLDPLLSEAERRVVLRGRNQAGRGPRRGAPRAYGQATGFETMLGWLFLQDPRRLAELLDHLEKTEPCPPSASP
ncbi:ribonuclease III [Cyanobium sp. Cruz CV13-4-11]|uniref:Mini-ribonuclease 3 n=1 Tax=unclassified Cyanobium TaxID=2627006 RepID=UPI0020CD1E8F|nr:MULTISPECIES: ribonuclease III domain-containing protein [unclassified Cyanobium]MCP9899184.1 ribonuclease III [Cyanobium sp. Cruz CV11-17]MCP9918071.1 ribonuclease III [Cyanobium sp. Cruz CV13-4-11]